MAQLGYGVKIAAPGTGLAVAQGASTGSLAGAYYYAISFVTNVGETVPSPSVGPTTINGTAALTAIPIGGENVTSRRVYRTVASGTALLLAGTISDNVTTTYSDSLADGSLGAAALVVSTADTVSDMYGYFVWDKPAVKSVAASITATTAPGPYITAELNNIATCPSSGAVTLIPLSTSLIGLTQTIKNNGANSCLITPSTGNTINTGANLALGAASYVTIFAASATNWQQISP